MKEFRCPGFLKPVKIILGLALLMGASCGAVAETNESLSISCSRSPVELLEESRSVIGNQVLCEAVGIDIQIDLIGGNRVSIGRTGDLTWALNLGRIVASRVEGSEPEIIVRPMTDTVWDVRVSDAQDGELANARRFVVWIRDYDDLGVSRRDFATLFGGYQVFTCSGSLESAEIDTLGRCLTFVTARVCDSWHEIGYGIRRVSYPTLAVRSANNEASERLLQNFEQVRQILEEMQDAILQFSCEEHQ